MKSYHIGLDFGTYQSKVCVYDLENDVHEFFRFSTNNKFFLPSRVAKKSDDTFEYGDVKSGQSVEEYHYFKIAAAEDEEFYAETFAKKGKIESNFYLFNEFKNYTPEFLSVLYVTYILFCVKERYRKKGDKKGNKNGFLNRLFATKETTGEDSINFTVQVGIPTEWSQEKNLRRKQKFESILLISELLQMKYETLEKYIQASSDQLLEDIKLIYSRNKFDSTEQFRRKLNELGISAYPETAAGLTFIIRTNQLNPGYYSILDIGAGSSDISFFQVVGNQQIKYLASESYMMAANNVYREIAENHHSVESVQAAEAISQQLIKSGNWQKNQPLERALKKVNRNLERIVYRLFNKRVYWFNKKMVSNYSNQPIIIYGGGVNLPKINEGRIEIHDSGNQVSLDVVTYVEKQNIERYSEIINILPKDESWKEHFPLLVVALGLSYIKPSSSADWFDDEQYNARDGDERVEIPHPVNEGYYIYDVLSSKLM